MISQKIFPDISFPYPYSSLIDIWRLCLKFISGRPFFLEFSKENAETCC